MNQLRPYQMEAVEETIASIRRGIPTNLIVLPTAGGKTRVATELANRLPGRLLFLVHRDELAQQAMANFSQHCPGKVLGLEKAESRCDPTACEIVVASVQTLVSRKGNRLQPFQCGEFWVVSDEAHHSTSATNIQIYEHLGVMPGQDGVHIGITATPQRGDRVGLEKIFRVISYQKSILDLMQDGITHEQCFFPYLSDVVGYRVYTDADISQVSTTQGDFNPKQLSQEVNTPTRNALVVQKYRELGEGMRGIAFTSSVQHSFDLEQSFRDAGIPARAVSGDTPIPERRDIILSYQAGICRVLVSCGLFGEGFDAPWAGVALLTRPSKSPLVYIQQVGRILRPYPSPENSVKYLQSGASPSWRKAYGIVIDFVDQCGRHRLVNLPSLFGLRATLDPKGKRMLQVVKEIEQLELEYPDLDVRSKDSLEEIRSYVERVNLLAPPILPPEIQKLSSLFWISCGSQQYSLNIPSMKGRFVVGPNLLNQWDVWFSSRGTRVRTFTCDTLAESISRADELVPQADRGILRSDAAYMKMPCTEKQVALLWKLDHKFRKQFDTPDSMFHFFRSRNRKGEVDYSKGSVSRMIDLQFLRMEHRDR